MKGNGQSLAWSEAQGPARRSVLTPCFICSLFPPGSMPRVVDRVTPILLNHHLRLSPLMTSPATIFDTLPLVRPSPPSRLGRSVYDLTRTADLQSFKDVPSKEGVDTRQFLDAVASLVVFLSERAPAAKFSLPGRLTRCTRSSRSSDTTLSSASINNFGKSLTEASKVRHGRPCTRPQTLTTSSPQVIEGELADFPVEAATLQSMVEHEGRPGDSSDNRGASTALLWMNRCGLASSHPRSASPAHLFVS